MIKSLADLEVEIKKGQQFEEQDESGKWCPVDVEARYVWDARISIKKGKFRVKQIKA